MIRSIATTTIRSLRSYKITAFSRPLIHNSKYNIGSLNITKKIAFQFADYPKHEVLRVSKF